MAKELKLGRLQPETNLLEILEAVHTDKTPRMIEREGEALAVVLDPEDYSGPAAPTTTASITRALEAAGAWKDLDTDAIVEKIYRARHEAPPPTA